MYNYIEVLGNYKHHDDKFLVRFMKCALLNEVQFSGLINSIALQHRRNSMLCALKNY